MNLFSMSRRRPTVYRAQFLVLSLVTFACLPAFTGLVSAGEMTLAVDAGKHSRVDTPIHWTLPRALATEGTKFRLFRIDGSREVAVPVQRLDEKPPRLVWILRARLDAGASQSYRLRYGGDAKSAAPAVSQVTCFDDGRSLLFSYRGRSIVRYNYGVVSPPDGFGVEYARSGYLHPIWNPSSQVISNDFPVHHKHHHGIWAPWTSTTFDGRKIDFWNSGKKQGRVEFVSMEGSGGGAVVAHFSARQRFLDLTAPGGEVEVLKETWKVKVYALSRYFLYDFESTQTCATDRPLTLHKYRYGGFGFRGPDAWEGKGDKCRFLTSEGVSDRIKAHATRTRWCDVHGVLDGKETGITFLCHPGNLHFPQNMRVHPSEPFFNYAPCQLAEFQIEPGKPYVSRYRVYVHDGAASAVASERIWHDYAHPPKVRVIP